MSAKKCVMLMAMLACLGTAWGSYYVYDDKLYIYNGTETDYQAIIADTANLTEYDYPYTSITLSASAVVINIGTYNLTSIENNGILVNYGTLNCSSSIINYSTGSIVNYGTIKVGTITNYGGTITNDGSIIDNTVTYYWIGTHGGTWTDSSNWSPEPGGSPLATGYPGSKDGDTAVFDASAELTVDGFTVAEGISELTILNKNLTKAKRIHIGTPVENYKLPNLITISGYVSFYGLHTANSVVITENSTLQSSALSLNNLTINSFGSMWITGNLEISGKFINNGTFSGNNNSSVTAVFSGVTNNGTINCIKSTVTFNADYTGGAGSKFTASSSSTIFKGNADFSASSYFTHNSGTVYFITSEKKTLKTYNNQTFNILRFGGNVTIDASAGTLNVAQLRMAADSAYYLSDSFTATITGGTVTVNSDGSDGSGELQIKRLSSSEVSATDDVIGTLKLKNTSLSAVNVRIHSGTELSLTSGSQLSASTSIVQPVADADHPNAIHNNGTITVTGTSVPQVSISGASANSRFVLDGEGEFIVSGGKDSFSGTNLSIGGGIKISATADSVTPNTFVTTTSIPASGVTYSQIRENGWYVATLGIFRWKQNAGSTDWSAIANWEEDNSDGSYSDATDYPNSANTVVTIPDECAKYPVVNEDISVSYLTLGDNATLTLGDADSDSYINFHLCGDYSSSTTIGGTLIFGNCDFFPPDDCDITLANIVINKFAEFEADSTAKVSVVNATYNNSPKLESYITLTIPGGSLGELDLEGSGSVTVTSEMNVTGSTIIDGHLVIESGDFSTNKLEFNSDDDSFTPAENSTVTITGSWKNTDGGTFNHNNSTVVFSNAGSGVSISGSANQNFYGFKVSGSLTSDSSITILGDADFSACTALKDTSDADIDVHFEGSSEQSLTFNATSSLVQFKNFLISSTSSVKASGNFSVSGNFNAEGGTFEADSGLLTFTGGNTVSGANTFYSLAFTPGTTVKFEAEKKQTVNGSISSPGVLGSTINLTSSAASPSKTDEATWWQLYMPNYDPDNITSSFPTFAYTNISYSRASSGTGSDLKDLTHDWGSSVGEGMRDSTAGWFLTTFYWLGTSDSSWTTSANWAYSANASDSVANYPSYNTGANSIIIATSDGGNDLTLSDEISVKSLTVNSGKSIDLKGYKVTADDSDVTTSDFVIENGGIVRLYGSSGQISSTYSLGDDSTVEYYNDSASPADIASLGFGSDYKNLKFGSGAKGSFSTALSVSGTTEIANGSTNALSLTGDNTFTDGLTVTSAGKITLKGKADSSGGTLRIGSLTCDSFEILSNAEFTQGCTIDEFICQTAGTTLTFAPDSSGNPQTLTVTKITIKGESGSEITLAGNESGGSSYKWNIEPDLSSSSNVSIAHAIIKNSTNLAADPIIVYAKDGYNIDGTGNTNWIFAGQKYVWLGADSTSPTSWNQTSNWSPASVPQDYSSVKIPLVSSGKYPILENDLDLGSGDYSFDLDGDGTKETSVSSSITLSNGSQFDFAGWKLSVKSILFDSDSTYSEIPGRIRVKGSEDLSGVTNRADVPQVGIIEYYDDFGTSLIWGNSYSLLEFTDGAKGSSSDAIIVSKGTLITNGSANSISLMGDNTFAGPVSLGNSTMAAGDITLNGDNTFTGGLSIISAGSLVLKGKKDSSTAFTIYGDASCTLLTLQSPVIFQNTDSTQTLQTVDADTCFYGNVTAENPIAFTGDIKSSGEVKIISSDSGYILAKGSENRTFGAESGTLTFASDTYIDLGATATLTISSDLSFEKNLFVYSGEISAGAVSLSVAKDFVIFGSSYSADDPRFAGDDTRFAYYGLENLSYQQSVFAASLSTAGTSFTVDGNFYANGLDLSDCSFSIPDNSASSPIFNPSAQVTEGQWGLPYAVLFNSTVTNCSVTCSDSTGSAFLASSVSQGVTDGSSGSGNAGFQFSIPQIGEAYSVSDSVICLSFDMDLENSNNEVVSSVAKVSSLAEGGIFYNGATLAFDGIFYTETDGTDCSLPLAESVWASTDIPSGTKLYLKVSSADNAWNTDATASSSGNEDSSDRSGNHRSRTTDLSLFEGLFYAAKGKTMGRNYGIGLWKDSGATSYSDAAAFPTVDKARPVLIDLLAGQELHTTNTGSAESQKPYDSHNFIELRYSEPVDIGDLPSGSTSDNQNVQAQTDFDSATSHGGAIIPDSTGLTLKGFVKIASGSIKAGYRDGNDHEYDNAKPHSLYRKFSRHATSSEEVQHCRIRISVAGYVDTANPVTIDGKSFNNWIGFIDSSETPSGGVSPLANPYITDLAVGADGTTLLKNVFDESNGSRTISVNEPSPSMQADSESVPGAITSLYGDWDCAHPVFAPYITSYDGSDSCSWTEGDSDTRTYELIGMVTSNTSAFLDHVEFHLFDNAQSYSSSDTYKWISQIGWTENGSEIKTIVHSAPEHSGGDKQFSMTQNRTLGGIRRSSLADALPAFEYSYTLDEETSETRSFGGTEVSQKVKSLLFRHKDLTITSTDNDGLYLTLQLNDKDNALPIGTGFTVTYYPDKSFITDLAGNRLLQTDGGSKKTLHSVDITPPSFSVVLSPIGEKKIYAVFTKPLAYGGTLLQDRSDLSSVLEKIRTNLEFVYSLEDKIDTDDKVSGEDEISIEKVELSSYSDSYTSLIFTLDRSIRLNDVEKIWLRVNDECEEVETFSGTIKASYFRDISENALPYHTCHAISDFAVNAVNVLYGYSVSDQDEGWDELGIYGTGVNSLSSDYAVHDFSEEGGNYARLRSGHDILFQLQLVGGVDSNGYYAFQNSEELALVIDKKSNLRSEWISDKFNLLTNNDWRIWLDAKLYSIASEYNHSPLSGSPLFEDVTGSDLLKNMTITNDDYKFTNKEEYQFFFKIRDPEKKTGMDTDENDCILINHDGDKTTPRIPLYAFRMPTEKITSGDFSFLDLWSFTISSITSQRGGVTILNNVIDASVGEKTVIEVDMQSSGNLNVFVMTLDGNIVQRLSKGNVSQGKHYFYWDGKNNAGNPVARGLYFVRVSGSGIDETRKVMVVK